ncbi:MAG: hypothetical protein V9G10_06280 [Candidatus Nanopelagicales bacterium]
MRPTVTRVLRVEPLRRIGLISYGLYLWHWPIAVMIGPDQTNAPTVVRLLLTFLAATVSYLVVERPVRAGRGNIKVLLVLPLVLVALAVLCTPKAADTRYLRGLPEHAAPDYRGEGTTTFVLGDSVSASLVVAGRDDAAARNRRHWLVPARLPPVRDAVRRGRPARRATATGDGLRGVGRTVAPGHGPATASRRRARRHQFLAVRRRGLRRCGPAVRQPGLRPSGHAGSR